MASRFAPWPLGSYLPKQESFPRELWSGENPASCSEGIAEKPQECRAPNFLNLRQ